MSEKREGKKLYNVFEGRDGADHRFKLKPTSKINVKNVCTVMAQRIGLTYKARASYADQAGIQPKGYYESEVKDEYGRVTDKRKLPEFELEDVWSEYYVHAALAQELFYAFPELVQTDYDEESDTYKVEILDEELFNLLDESEVNKAFLDFSQQRNGILNSLLKSLSK